MHSVAMDSVVMDSVVMDSERFAHFEGSMSGSGGGPSPYATDPRMTHVQASLYWCITVLYHPDPTRIGGQVRWRNLPHTRLRLSHSEPTFTSPDGLDTYPLGTPLRHLQALIIHTSSQGLVVQQESDSFPLWIDSRRAGPREQLPLSLIQQGVLLKLGEDILLLLHPLHREAPAQRIPTLLGVSEPILALHELVERLAHFETSVLLTGESGTGKELVAQALHQISRRREQRFVAVNMAALSPATAAAELFGHARGAFTGASDARTGYFGMAEGGTLFLDEIGEASSEVQALLLRAVESHEIQPLGQRPRPSDVRIIAATDADLETLVSRGQFRRSLFFRLATTTVRIPPLRQRRIDIPLLFLHFLREALAHVNASARLNPSTSSSTSWLKLQDIQTLLQHDWPGNVRELRNVAFQCALYSYDAPQARLPEVLQSLTPRTMPDRPPASPATAPQTLMLPPRPKVRLDLITEAGLREALEANHWRIGAAASQLGISRKSVYQLMARFGIRNAGELSNQEIEDTIQATGTLSPETLAGLLKVSVRGLKLRMSADQGKH